MVAANDMDATIWKASIYVPYPGYLRAAATMPLRLIPVFSANFLHEGESE
jgi:hypothetical protein